VRRATAPKATIDLCESVEEFRNAAGGARLILYCYADQMILEQDGRFFQLGEKSFDALVVHPDLQSHLQSLVQTNAEITHVDETNLVAPIGHQEVWAAGVTYFRSRTARMQESKEAGGGDFYDRVYSAERPELFFKALPHKVVSTHNAVKIRRDAAWSVPEPELVLLINPRGEIIGYTVGNDMSSRDIEGQNLLYLPQAKIYDGSCALGPGILLSTEPLPLTTAIQLEILRDGQSIFSGATTLSEMKRRPEELVEYLFRDQTFKFGCFLLTGTGIIPPDSFSLRIGDTIRINIDGIGTLVNHVA
jgi:2-dehydro-3-deoxy-D-arabinonate dehydratase